MMDSRLKKQHLLYWLIIIGLVFSQSFQLYYSAMPSFSLYFNIGLAVMIVNALIVALIDFLFVFIFRKWSRALLFTSILFSLWSVANYYVIEFHGSPIFFSEFGSIGAALAVAGGYSYKLSKAVIGLLLIFSVEIIAVFFLFRLHKSLKTESNLLYPQSLYHIAAFFLDLLILYLGLFSPLAVKPAVSMGWSWVTGVEKYGYPCCVVEDLSRIRNLVLKPKDYNIDIIQVKTEKNDRITTGEYPDIIFVVNESFCDIGYYSDVDTSIILERFRSIENSVVGWAVAPDIGGGTNDTEYEILTSNSMYLVPATAPFNFSKLRKPKASIVSALDSIGYVSWGMHCGIKTNYSRNVAYPMLGFDSVLLGEDSFHYHSVYGNREWLDKDNYQDLMDQFEENSKFPQFMYLLTYQNHGGWEQNEPEMDTIHIDQDFGDMTDDVDEYMTSVKMSVEAFEWLTEYFSRIDRHVIICMVGDHAPSFISNLPTNRQMTYEESEISKRVVPYIIWANFDVEFPEYTDYSTMIDLVPMVMKTAQLPLSTYYEYILKLHDAVPVRLRNGILMDRNGNISVYNEQNKYYDMLTQYYYMEYNALLGGEDYRGDLFELK